MEHQSGTDGGAASEAAPTNAAAAARGDNAIADSAPAPAQQQLTAASPVPATATVTMPEESAPAEAPSGGLLAAESVPAPMGTSSPNRARTGPGPASPIGPAAIGPPPSPPAAPTASAGASPAAASPSATDLDVRRMTYERDLLRHQLKASASEKEQLRTQMRSLQQQLTDALSALHAAAAAAAATTTATATGATSPAALPPVVEGAGAAAPSAAVLSGTTRLFSVFDTTATAAALEAAADGLSPSGEGSAVRGGPASGEELRTHGSVSAGGGAVPRRASHVASGPAHPGLGGRLLGASPTGSGAFAASPSPSPGLLTFPSSAFFDPATATAVVASLEPVGSVSGRTATPLTSAESQSGGALQLRIRTTATAMAAGEGCGGGGGGGVVGGAVSPGGASQQSGAASGLHAFSQPVPSPFESPRRNRFTGPFAGGGGGGTQPQSYMASLATSPRYGGSVLASVAQSPVPRLPHQLGWGWVGAGGSRFTSRPASPPPHNSDLLAAIQKLEAMTGSGGELRPAVEAELGSYGLAGGAASLELHSLLDERLVEGLRDECEGLRAQVEYLQRDKGALEARLADLQEQLRARDGDRAEGEEAAELAGPDAAARMAVETTPAAAPEMVAQVAAGVQGEKNEAEAEEEAAAEVAAEVAEAVAEAVVADQGGAALVLQERSEEEEEGEEEADTILRREEVGGGGADEDAVLLGEDAGGFQFQLPATTVQSATSASLGPTMTPFDNNAPGAGGGGDGDAGAELTIDAASAPAAAAVSAMTAAQSALETTAAPVALAGAVEVAPLVQPPPAAAAAAEMTRRSPSASPVRQQAQYRGTAESVGQEERRECRELLADILGPDLDLQPPGLGPGESDTTPPGPAAHSASAWPDNTAVGGAQPSGNVVKDAAVYGSPNEPAPPAATEWPVGASAAAVSEPPETPPIVPASSAPGGSAAARSRRTVLVPYLDRVAATAATAASATGIGQGAAAGAMAAGVQQSSPAAAAAYYSGYSAGVAAGATTAAAIDLPRVASLANMLIENEEAEEAEGAAEEAREGRNTSEPAVGGGAFIDSTAEPSSPPSAGGNSRGADVGLDQPMSRTGRETGAGGTSSGGGGGAAAGAARSAHTQQQAALAVSLAAASGVVRAAAGSVLPPLTAAAVAENLATAAVQAAERRAGSRSGTATPPTSRAGSTALPLSFAAAGFGFGGTDEQKVPAEASASAAPTTPALRQPPSTTAASASPTSPGIAGFVTSPPSSDALAASTTAALAPAIPSSTGGGQLLFGAFNRGGGVESSRGSSAEGLVTAAIAASSAAASRHPPEPLRLHHLAIAELVAQLSESEAALSSARRSLDAREAALRDSRAALAAARLEAARAVAAQQGALTEAREQVQALSEKVSEHQARERGALRAKAELEARLALAGVEGGAAEGEAAEEGAVGPLRSREEVQAGVRVVIPSLDVDERRLLDEQLAERDEQVLSLRSQLAAAARAEGAVARMAAELAFREAQVMSLTQALARASLMLSGGGAGTSTGSGSQPQPPRPQPRPRRASFSDAAPGLELARPVLPAGSYDLPPLPPRRGGDGSSGTGSGGGALLDSAAPAAINDDARGGTGLASYNAGGGGMPATPPASPSTSPLQLSRSPSAMAALGLQIPTGTSAASSAAAASTVIPVSSRVWERRLARASAPIFPTAVSDFPGGPQQLYDMMLAAAGEAMAATDSGGGSPGSGDAEADVEAREAAAARAAAAAAAAGLLDPSAAEALRLRLLLESASREVWALRNRLAAVEAEAQAQRQAELEGLSGVLDVQGQLVSRLRAQLTGLMLRNQGGPLLERLRLATTQRELTGGGGQATEGVAEGETSAGAVGRGGEGAGEGQGSNAEAPAGPAALVASSLTRRLLAEAAAHISGLQQQLALESGLRGRAEAELQELRELFDSYVQRTVAQVQQSRMSAAP
ncbi:hypothetical protein PLESTM_000936300 [Pleodorina starrii]|nr:hypothetical protein PLESTM_000936300 [Pleodorina starrii]